MPGWLDFALVALFAAAWPLYTHFIEWPRHVLAVEAGDPTARSRIYVRTILPQGALATATLTLCLRFGRPLAALRLRAPGGWRLAFGAPRAVAELSSGDVPHLAMGGGENARARSGVVA